jgi:hypothetical protein
MAEQRKYWNEEMETLPPQKFREVQEKAKLLITVGGS